jgi:hypothetical protein
MIDYKESFYYKIITVNIFINNVKGHIKADVDQALYNGACGKILSNYSELLHELIQHESPNLDRCRNLVIDSFELIQNLNVVASIDEIRNSFFKQ